MEEAQKTESSKNKSGRASKNHVKFCALCYLFYDFFSIWLLPLLFSREVGTEQPQPKIVMSDEYVCVAGLIIHTVIQSYSGGGNAGTK